jgi:rhamnogalacturonan endolyase
MTDQRQNNGSSADAVERAVAELSNWPYSWMADTGGYMERGSIKGRIRLTDGRPASGAAIFLGDNRPNKTTLTQGSGYYYRTYADRNGAFKLSHVRGGLRNLQAWPNGGPIGDVTTVFSMNDVRVTPGAATDLGELAWMPQRRVRMVWQIGELDRTAKGFGLSGPPHEHARSRKCPANLVFEVGRSDTKDWCFAQVHPGVWSIRFNVDNSSMVDAALTISLAAYTSGVSAMVSLNDRAIGQMNIRNIGAGDPALFRSGTLAGEWHMVRVPINGTLWRPGPNKIDIRIRSGKGLWTASDTKILSKNPWRGFMYDSLLLELED